jgi:hypothetical protein
MQGFAFWAETRSGLPSRLGKACVAFPVLNHRHSFPFNHLKSSQSWHCRYKSTIFFWLPDSKLLLLIPTKKRKNAKLTQNHNFASLLRSTQERRKTHDTDFCCKDWREHKTLRCGASKTTLMLSLMSSLMA